MAYGYGFPLVLMDVSREVMTAVPPPLYSLAWLDLAPEPIVLRVPDVGDRYYLMQICDAWTNVFAAPGTRTTGNGVPQLGRNLLRIQEQPPTQVRRLPACQTTAWPPTTAKPSRITSGAAASRSLSAKQMISVMRSGGRLNAALLGATGRESRT